MTERRRRYLYWFCALIAAWITICHSSYAPNDGDGTLYSNIAGKIAKMEMSELIQVGWYDYNRTYSPDAAESRYFYEHPPGLFILPWFLAKLGLPATKLTLLAETLYQVVALFFFYLLLKKWANRTIAGWFTLSILFMPVSFWYVLRPVHETPMLAALVAALYIVSYFSELRLLVLALLFLAGGIAGLMKGIMVAPITVMCGLAGFILPRPKKNSFVVAALCFSAFGAGAYCFLTAFDKYRMMATGDTFWLPYLRIQLWNRALEDSSTVHVLFRTIKHGLLYAGAMLYYTLPWGLAGCIYGFRSIRKVESFKPWSSSSRKWRRFYDSHRLEVLSAIGTVVLSFPFSIFARDSVRYIYSAYYMFSIFGFLMLVNPIRLVLQTHPDVARRLHGTDPVLWAAVVWLVSKVGAVLLKTA